MATCSRCGQPVEFRYIDGKCIPLHLNGGCGSESSVLSARDYSGHLHSRDSTCFRTTCPQCGESVFFIRHNGGSVWIDSPLGPPWYKHPCMDTQTLRASGERSSLLDRNVLFRYRNICELIVGVVKKAETASDSSFTLLDIETGETADFCLAVKNRAGFLVGRIVIVDLSGSTIKWIDDDNYSFFIMNPTNVAKFLHLFEIMIACPVCGQALKTKNLRKHLRRMHGQHQI